MKRLIFALLREDGSYMLSRNFRRQRIGDIDWVLRNYRLADMSEGLDEIIVLNVGARRGVDEGFLSEVRQISRECFIPITAGGGIRSVADVERLLEAGTDKILLNEPFFTEPHLCEEIAQRYGSQFLIQGLDIASRSSDGGSDVRLTSGRVWEGSVADAIELGATLGAGELLLQSVDRDGTGVGLDLDLVNDYGVVIRKPLILMGGVGKIEHILQGLSLPEVDAVATANLLNFVGDAFSRARMEMLAASLDVSRPPSETLADLRGAVL